MNQRTVIALLAAVVVLVLVATFGRQSGAPTSATGQLFAPALAGSLDAIDRVAIQKANGETVATLEKRPERWVVTSAHGYDANVGKLRQALVALGEAKVLEEKTASADFYSRLGVEDVTGENAAGLRVTLRAGEREVADVILGNAEGSRYRYVRRAGDAQSYLIDKNPDFSRATAQWLDAQIVDVRTDRVKQVTITHADGETVTITKAGPELTNFDVADVPAGRELLYPGVANVIGNSLRELNLEDVEPATDPAPAGDATTVEFRTFDGLVVQVSGVKTDDASLITLVASVDAEPATPPADGAADPAAEAARINARVGAWRYKIAGFQYDQMTRRMADLLKPPSAD
jgi:hypothetical protein